MDCHWTLKQCHHLTVCLVVTVLASNRPFFHEHNFIAWPVFTWLLLWKCLTCQAKVAIIILGFKHLLISHINLTVSKLVFMCRSLSSVLWKAQSLCKIRHEAQIRPFLRAGLSRLRDPRCFLKLLFYQIKLSSGALYCFISISQYVIKAGLHSVMAVSDVPRRTPYSSAV